MCNHPERNKNSKTTNKKTDSERGRDSERESEGNRKRKRGREGGSTRTAFKHLLSQSLSLYTVDGRTPACLI